MTTPEPFEIVPAASSHLDQWAAMRHALWPEATVDQHRRDAAETYLSGRTSRTAFIAMTPAGDPVGFVELDLRRDYVEGCNTSPVGFIEGIFVIAAMRGRGVGRRLAERAVQWARAQGCSEIASNALLDNSESHAFHQAIGFAETERVVYFRRQL